MDPKHDNESNKKFWKLCKGLENMWSDFFFFSFVVKTQLSQSNELVAKEPN